MMSRSLILFAVVIATALAGPVQRRVVLNGETMIPFPELVARYYNVFQLQNPTGLYEGAKSILGQNIDAKIAIESGSDLRFTISGAVSIDCDHESYTFASSSFNFPGLSKAGDCLHDTLVDNNVSLQSVTYDATSDSITAKVKYSIVSISLVLNKVGQFSILPAKSSMKIDRLVENYYNVFMLQAPAGTYVGSKTVLGQTIKSTVVIESDSTFSFSVDGPASITCDQEAYVFSNNQVTLPNVGKDGDCLHDALKDNNITLESFTYDAAANEIDFTVKYSIVKIAMQLKHQN